MIKEYCDTCGEEIQKGEMVAEFKSLEYNYMNPKTGPVASVYVLCHPCSKEIKKAVVALIDKIKLEKKG